MGYLKEENENSELNWEFTDVWMYKVLEYTYNHANVGKLFSFEYQFSLIIKLMCNRTNLSWLPTATCFFKCFYWFSVVFDIKFYLFH